MVSPKSPPRLQFARSVLRILLLSCLLLPALPLFALGSAGADQHPILLVPHKPALVHLPWGGFVVFALDAHTHQEAEILVETSAPNTDFEVLTPSGNALLAVNVKEVVH